MATPDGSTVEPPAPVAEVQVPAERERLRRRRVRSVAIAFTLAAFVLLFYVITIFKLSSESGVPTP